MKYTAKTECAVTLNIISLIQPIQASSPTMCLSTQAKEDRGSGGSIIESDYQYAPATSSSSKLSLI